ncbi:MAG: MGMT family protein [Bacteroidales bacterium]|nr:MGMT family protein [Bacteroidales bacterium]
MVDKDNFFSKVHAIAMQIPYGKVTSYGAIAKHLGMPRSARMVGWAMNGSHKHSPPIPAHRVVNRKGLLTGKQHFGGSDIMCQLLKNEGIEIKDNQIINLEKYFWDPEKEIK